MFIPLTRIAATSYTNILQRTFNIVTEVFSGDGDATEELEFSMLDQEDYGGIDEYIKRNRLQDRSMAEQRKAKLELAENRGPKKNAEENGAAADGEAGQEGMSELQKAQLEVEQELQDEEDEDEEDYDPGSDADSDGSGDSSDDDDDDDDEDDEEDEEDGEEEGEGEGEGEDEAAEEEEEPQPEVAAPPPVKKPVKQVPVKTGWAALRSVPRATESMELDEEKFDVV